MPDRSSLAVAEKPRVGFQHPDVPWNGLTVTDLFCGAGGSSTGLVQAGYRVVIAANHWPLAIRSHQLNHPETDHTSANLSQVDPRYFPSTDVLWASPECTNHSIAKGVKRLRAMNESLFELDGTRPLEDAAANRSRATMWDVPRFAEVHKYRAIVIENVVDAYRWIMFPAWLQAMELLGYRHEIVWLNSMHAQAAGLPAPQSRDRMYVVFWRKDGKRRPDLQKWTRPAALCLEHGEIRAAQSFKKHPSWGRYRAQYVYRCPTCGLQVEPGWVPALSIVDWSIPAPRIGDRKKPLAPKTRERVSKGIQRHWGPIVAEAAGNVYDSTSPRHPRHGDDDGYLRAWPATDPLRTIHGTQTKALAVPLVVRGEGNTVPARPATDPMGSVTAAGSMFLVDPLVVPLEGRDGIRARAAGEPMRTQTARAVDALVVPYHRGGTPKPVDDPLGTITTVDGAALLVPMRNHGVAGPITDPIATVSAEGNHHALVVTNQHANRARPVTEPMPTATTGNTHALIMRNNHGGAEMSTPITEPIRALTTGGHQSVIDPGDPISLDVDDAGFRMFEPHEIQLGMAFPADYVIDGTKREKIKQAGNAVTPPVPRDIGFALAEYLNG